MRICEALQSNWRVRGEGGGNAARGEDQRQELQDAQKRRVWPEEKMQTGKVAVEVGRGGREVYGWVAPVGPTTAPVADFRRGCGAAANPRFGRGRRETVRQLGRRRGTYGVGGVGEAVSGARAAAAAGSIGEIGRAHV